MGEEIEGGSFSRSQRQRYREKVHGCLEVLAEMLAGSSFDAEEPLTGCEVELNLVDEHFQPLLRNLAVLEEIADPAFQTELGSYNIELNLPPTSFTGRGPLDLEQELRRSLNAAEARANRCGAHTVMVGILPTITAEHLAAEGWMSPSARYAALNAAILAARGEDIPIEISGTERLSIEATTLAPESACTSAQLHLQVAPEDFARTWNAAQVLAGPQLALGANSPFFLGRQLWQETRSELFLQSTDTRSVELRNQGVRPRVWFGERWITTVLDLFEENVRYFPALLPEVDGEDPRTVHASGAAPSLRELRLLNGTIYRWNRPVYDVVDARPHLRVENRVLPAGPTVLDVVANAAFFYGVLWTLRSEESPIWSRMSFRAAEDNFHRCARWGTRATVHWPGLGEVGVCDLVLHRLLPMAHAGLESWGVAAEARERYLGVIEARARTGRNGAWWQAATVRALEAAGTDRPTALRRMLRHYCQAMHSNEPVHTWQVPASRVLGP
ncbi:MAG: glutamate--cysteine ligase [Actinomycetales bacterium]|nr:glutamate--cysteine ligase [Actinomycetales bacterium]